MAEHEQLSLSLDLMPRTGPTEEGLVMDATALAQWKSRIFNYQQQVRENPQQQPATLFDIAPSYCDPDKIEPLKLQLQPMSFYRMPDNYGQPALYFVLDSTTQLILYIGETSRSNKRWKGLHDCKDYIAAYIDLHRRYQMEVAVNIAFYFDAPSDRKLRQELEQQLIQKWRSPTVGVSPSPFNKEMWDLWGQPFQAVK